MKTSTKLLSYLLLFFFLGAGTLSFANGHPVASCPSATISYAGSPYCSNAGTASVTLTGDAGGYYSSAPGLVIDVNTGDVDLSNSTSGSYTVTYTIPANNTCSEFTTTANITVTAAPNASFYYAGSPYCTNGGTAYVNFTGTLGGTFYNSKDILAIDPFTGTVDLGSSTPGTYTVWYTVDVAGGCGPFITSATITISAAPYALISYPNSPYCSSSGNIKVYLQGDGGGIFSSSAGLVIDANTGLIDPAASTPGTYTVYYMVSNNCGSYTTSTSIIIISAPYVSISYDNSPYCSNAGIAYVTFIGTGGGTYSSSAGLTIDASNGQIDLAASTPGDYTVNYTVSLGNCSTTAYAAVTITAAPNASIFYPSSPYCTNGGLAYVNLNGTPGGTFSAPAGLAINSTTGTVDLTSSTEGTYTVTYYVASSGGCSDFSTTTDIAITAAPTASFSYPNSPYCSGGGTAMVSFTGATGGTFSSTPNLSIDSNTGTVDLAASIPGDYTVYYILTGGTCGGLHVLAGITINATPNPSISYTGSPYCSASGIASVTQFGTGGGTYSAGAGLSLNTFNGDVDLSASTPGDYTVTYTVSENGCTVSTNATITIVAAPFAMIAYNGSPYNSSAGTASVTIMGDTGGTFSSDPGLAINSTTGDIDLASCIPGTYTVTYTITPSSPCGVFTTSANVTIIGNIIIRTNTQHVNNGNHPALTVYPNPVTGSTLTLQLRNMDMGTYTVSLYNSLGQKVFTKQLQYSDGKSTIFIDIKNLLHGTYELILTDKKNKSLTKRIIKK